MKEAKFYELLEIVEQFNDNTDGYYPTVQEMKNNGIEEHLNDEKVIPFLAYFASDPLKETAGSDEDYVEAVKYAKNLLAQVELEE